MARVPCPVCHPRGVTDRRRSRAPCQAVAPRGGRVEVCGWKPSVGRRCGAVVAVMPVDFQPVVRLPRTPGQRWADMCQNIPHSKGSGSGSQRDDRRTTGCEAAPARAEGAPPRAGTADPASTAVPLRAGATCRSTATRQRPGAPADREPSRQQRAHAMAAGVRTPLAPWGTPRPLRCARPRTGRHAHPAHASPLPGNVPDPRPCVALSRPPQADATAARRGVCRAAARRPPTAGRRPAARGPR